MNWKKFLLIGVAVSGFAFAGVPQADAGVRVGIGIGVPIGYGYGYGYHPYRYRHRYAYPYDYYGYPRGVVYVSPRRYYRHRHYRGCGHRRYVRHHRVYWR